MIADLAARLFMIPEEGVMITKTVDEAKAQNMRRETDGLAAAQVPVDKLRGLIHSARLSFGASVWA